MESDFAQLYVELKLPPDCTLEEFNRAYRRRIAKLHPDRRGPRLASKDADAALSELLATYTAVNRFHRRYGRMPGTSRRPAGPIVPGAPRSGPTARPQMLVPREGGRERGSRPTAWLFVLFLGLIVLLATWDWVAATGV